MKARATAVGAATVLLCCVAAACGNSGSRTAEQVSNTPTPPTTASAAVHPSASAPVSVIPLPITGLPASRGNQNARVVAVSLLPATGDPAASSLRLAETVYVEYSDTLRLLALYQSVAGQNLGPVGPTRPADGAILGVLHPIYANAGGPSGFVAILDQSTVGDVSSARDAAAFTSTAGGLTTSTQALRAAAPAAAPPPPLFTFGSAGESLGTGAVGVHTATVSVPGQPAVQWNYDTKTGHWLTGAPVFSAAAPESLIVQQVDYKTVQVHHPDGAYVPSARVYGHGTATFLSGGSVVKGQWSKPGSDAITVFSDSTGVPVRLRPGTTWVLLVPSGTTVTYK